DDSASILYTVFRLESARPACASIPVTVAATPAVRCHRRDMELDGDLARPGQLDLNRLRSNAVTQRHPRRGLSPQVSCGTIRVNRGVPRRTGERYLHPRCGLAPGVVELDHERLLESPASPPLLVVTRDHDQTPATPGEH